MKKIIEYFAKHNIKADVMATEKKGLFFVKIRNNLFKAKMLLHKLDYNYSQFENEISFYC